MRRQIEDIIYRAPNVSRQEAEVIADEIVTLILKNYLIPRKLGVEINHVKIESFIQYETDRQNERMPWVLAQRVSP